MPAVSFITSLRWGRSLENGLKTPSKSQGLPYRSRGLFRGARLPWPAEGVTSKRSRLNAA
ncbi:MAG: hypothetical protein JNG84_13490 [Archangium sp.]|nr:hypothetical protein [Archangium sp.]